MRELKILAVVVALTLITYWGVEPYAHSQMHPHVAPADFKFSKADDSYASEIILKITEDIKKAEDDLKNSDSYSLEDYVLMFFGNDIDLKERKGLAEKNLITAKENLEKAKVAKQEINNFWLSNKDTISLKGNATNGQTLVSTNCTACHSLEKQGFPKVMDNASAAAAYGVTPPDLGTAGKLYSADYLVAFIKNPPVAAKVAHKFVDGKTHPMPNFDWMQPQEIADIVAYLQSIAPKEMTNKEVFSNACQRCHSIKYADLQKETMVAFTPNDDIKRYMGKVPPDLSQVIRSRGEHYLETFVNNPQKHLEGTAMPRVGLTEEAQKQVVAYLEEVGDSKKEQREELGPKFLIYLVIFAIFAFLWKASKWREVH